MTNSPKVTKALIVAAGRGTRFLPITKIVPKEMLPIGNKPTLHYLLEECKTSGITEVAVVVREWGSLTEQYFAPDKGLEEHLKAKGKTELLEAIANPGLGMQIDFLKQRPEYPVGHGSPVLSAKDWIGVDNFALFFCDDLFKAEVPALKQLMDAWNANPELAGIVSSSEMPRKEIHSKSSLKFRPDKLNAGVRLVETYIEKPKTEAEIFSNECFVGRGVYRSDIIEQLEQNLIDQVVDHNGEFNTFDAMFAGPNQGRYGALKIDGKWLTTGNPSEMRIATQEILG